MAGHQCFPLPDGVDDARAVLMEPLAVALHAAHRAGSLAGRRVLITGGGPIGLLEVAVARAFGAATVVVSDPEPVRRQTALQMGADLACDPTEVVLAEYAQRALGDGFDVLFEASGAERAVQESFEAVRRGGTIVQIGVFTAGSVTLPLNQLMIRELQLVGSFRYGNVWEEGIRLVARGRINLTPLVSQVFPLREAARAANCRRTRSGHQGPT